MHSILESMSLILKINGEDVTVTFQIIEQLNSAPNKYDFYMFFLSLAEKNLDSLKILHLITMSRGILPSILVATQVDAKSILTSHEAMHQAVQLKMLAYYECSVFDHVYVNETILDTIYMAYNIKYPSEKPALLSQTIQLRNLSAQPQVPQSQSPKLSTKSWNWFKKKDKTKEKDNLIEKEPGISVESPESQLKKVKLNHISRFKRPSFDISLTDDEMFLDFEKYFNNESSPYDVVFICGNKKFYCHKILLCFKSVFFNAAFSPNRMAIERSNKKVEEIYIEDEISEKALEIVLKFCYNPTLPSTINAELADPLLKLNNKYYFAGLDEAIKQAMNKRITFHYEKTEILQYIEQNLVPALKEFKHMSDVTFKVEDQVYNLHLAILGCRSSWFEAMCIKHNWRETREACINIQTMSADTFTLLVEFLYTGRISKQPIEIYMELMAIAHEQLLDRLLDLCAYEISCQLTPCNLISVLQMAELYTCSKLIEICYYEIMVNYESINESDFDQLNENNIKRIRDDRQHYITEQSQFAALDNAVANMRVRFYKDFKKI